MPAEASGASGKRIESQRTMPQPEEKHLQQLLVHLEKVPRPQLQQKFVAYFKKGQKGQPSQCCLEDFAAFFLSALRHHTKKYYYSRSSETPVKSLTPIRTQKPLPEDVIQEPLQEEQLFDESLANRSASSAASTSTPARQQTQSRRSTPASAGGQFCSTPQSGGANRSAAGGGAAGHSFCLGDFLVNTPNQSQQRMKKKTTPQSQGGVATAASTVTPQSKPRRRVLPMTISKNVSANSSFGDTSSFSNDNNLWRLSQSSEIFDRSQGAALDMEARKSLLLHKQEIKSEAPVNLSQQEQRTPDEEVLPVESVSLEDVRDTGHLQLLSAIYGLLIDLNLVPNVLSELSFAIHLLNIRVTTQSPEEPTATKPFERLSDYKSCIFFAAQLLENQQKLLLQLDRKTMGVLLQNERLSLLPQSMVQQLEASCQQKQDCSREETAPSSAQQNVYFHEEKDSRDNFPSENEFRAFKSQRDLFYKSFKLWESSHLNRVFNFASELNARVREIFKVSDHPVNMAHFAKLFVSQLLISGTESTESPEELGLKLDPLRLNRLAQRLVTSNSSVEGQFPRSQAFFRDFITSCPSMAFLVQLKIALYVQLMRHNESTFELLQLSEDVGEEQSAQQGPYIVRVQTMANMLILAKFLGFVTVLPFSGTTQHAGPAPALLCPQQLQLRSHFQPEFQLRDIVERSMRQGKLLITLPWLVHYLVMLDLVSLQLPDSLATLELLFGLYASLRTEKMQPGAVFIVRSCIGWLLDAQPQLVIGYYAYRKRESGSSHVAATVEHCLSGLRSQEGSLAPSLEELLPVACPFVQEFRVSITPSRQARSGRFRYITTRLEQLKQNSSSSSKEAIVAPAELTPADLQQRRLADAFLHSQNASTRRLIEFVTERCFKCVVKDAQQEILLPSKAAADGRVNEICSLEAGEVLLQLQQIFQQAREQACQSWKEKVPQLLNQRITKSLEALLPASTNEALRSTYAHLVRCQAQVQLQQWLQASVMQSTFYHGDLEELATKVCHSNKFKATSAEGGSSELQLSSDVGFSLSELLFQLQQWRHSLSLRPESVGTQKELAELLRQCQEAVLLKQLPTVFYHLIGSGLVHLLQLLITKKPELLTLDVTSTCCVAWLSPQLLPGEGCPSIFEGLLNVTFIGELEKNPYGFLLLEELLRAMLKTGVIRADQLNDLFMPLFRENWTPTVWAPLSNLLQQLSVTEGVGVAQTASSVESPEDEAKSHLFMEMLADLSRDLDSF
ncbi:protein disks lost [Drosophila ananassae]|uniref:protein disks lost n=1 Tax=Drosophila ananassae TaxID=7217 RepID=UPI0013A5D520|nr:protein disks lost [Drosophila ananassae]XP_014765337.2 protein disks lost [Drosophila ananassae]XP_014765338.2 protein disks lost [Drosophila ananassae]XP_044570772.1 protein disks lost [Drosophila ananassae]